MSEVIESGSPRGIKEIHAMKAIRMLEVTGARFAVILEGGQKFGDLDVVVPVEKKRIKSVLPLGYMKAHIDQFLLGLKVGDVAVVTVPPGSNVNHTQSSVTAWCSTHFGNGAYATCKRGDTVEVLRTE